MVFSRIVNILTLLHECITHTSQILLKDILEIANIHFNLQKILKKCFMGTGHGHLVINLHISIDTAVEHVFCSVLTMYDPTRFDSSLEEKTI